MYSINFTYMRCSFLFQSAYFKIISFIINNMVIILRLIHLDLRSKESKASLYSKALKFTAEP